MRIRVVVVCLLLALLPLRGWTQAAMQTGMASAAIAVALADEGDWVDDATSAHALDAVPCHTAGNDGRAADADADATGPGSDATPHSSCASCDLCYAALAGGAEAPAAGLRVDVSRQPVPAFAQSGRLAIGGLERPPRHLPA